MLIPKPGNEMELGTWGQLDSQKSRLFVLWVVRDPASDGCTNPCESIINYVAIKKVNYVAIKKVKFSNTFIAKMYFPCGTSKCKSYFEFNGQ